MGLETILALTDNLINIGLQRGLNLRQVRICNDVEMQIAWE